ncbi:hypothetical protein [Pseudoflavonifractor sp. MSJ-37]|uniref:hypothetical protein n=1 Tax=Pseudoflavonifractor sp. MSJ-37 TaxID=2841531 RepID=UPI001C119347|nr:hypothetical protein [Pseudoflavonifractor sp. MSJ-37]MBU5435894.1 hypothetical protein [Pseudoflavonifractor sp. MSJ-37]
MLRILNTLSLLIFLIAAVWSVRLFLGRARRAACGWAAAAMAALISCSEPTISPSTSASTRTVSS